MVGECYKQVMLPMDEDFQVIDDSIEDIIIHLSTLSRNKAVNRLNRIRRDVMTLRNDVKADIYPPMKMHSIKKTIAVCFLEYIGKAPVKLLAERVAELLNRFGVQGGAEAIRKIMRRPRIKFTPGIYCDKIWEELE